MVVVDNNILSSLAKIERLDWLPTVFGTVTTTSSVLEELHRDAVSGYEFVNRIDAVKTYNDGWLHITTPTEDEIERTESILDPSLSFTDAECIAVAATRGKRLLSDDSHVGTIGAKHEVDVWDLLLFLEACIGKELIDGESELEGVIDDLEQKDFYRFSNADRDELYSVLER